MADREISEEIAEIVEKVIMKNLQSIEFPTEMKVEVMNPTEIPEPQKIDLSGLEKAFREFANSKKETTNAQEFKRLESVLKDIVSSIKNTPDNSESLNKILLTNELINLSADFAKLTEQMSKPLTVRGGGAIGPSKIFIKDFISRADTPETFEDTSLSYKG